jgi:hypothetical protein
MSGAQLSKSTSGAPSPPAISFAFLHTLRPMSPREDRREEGRGKKGSAAMDSWRQKCPGATAIRAQEQKKSGAFPFDTIHVLDDLVVRFHVLDVIPVPAFCDAESILVHRFLDCWCGLIGMAMVNSWSL